VHLVPVAGNPVRLSRILDDLRRDTAFLKREVHLLPFFERHAMIDLAVMDRGIILHERPPAPAINPKRAFSAHPGETPGIIGMPA
jgi:hypothetical protein